MTHNELDLLMSHIDAMHGKLDKLDDGLRAHMKQEEKTTQRIEKRITSLEWKAHGFATIFGAFGALAITKIKTLLGIDGHQ